MKYTDIIKEIAIRENLSEKEVEMEMEIAIKLAGVDCSVKEFLEMTARVISEKTIYSKLV